VHVDNAAIPSAMPHDDPVMPDVVHARRTNNNSSSSSSSGGGGGSGG